MRLSVAALGTKHLRPLQRWQGFMFARSLPSHHGSQLTIVGRGVSLLSGESALAVQFLLKSSSLLGGKSHFEIGNSPTIT
jgi:hypothetical protein